MHMRILAAYRFTCKFSLPHELRGLWVSLAITGSRASELPRAREVRLGPGSLIDAAGSERDVEVGGGETWRWSSVVTSRRTRGGRRLRSPTSYAAQRV